MNPFAEFSTLSFDCYGTLIDWETGIAAALQPWAARTGLELDAEQLIAAHGRHETLVQQERPTARYPDVLAETLRRIGGELGAAVSDQDAAAYGASVGEWPAFPDSAEALRRLVDRYKLVILSNVDRDSFAKSHERLGVEFDLIVTAEDVGSYKPDLRNFHAMFARLRDLRTDRAELLHVAESLYHDHGPAQRLGLPSVWIHRRLGKEGHGATAQPAGVVEPEWVYPSMASFADTAARQPAP